MGPEALDGGALAGETRFDDGEILIDRQLVGGRLRRVLLHELGHWLALSPEHSDAAEDVMHDPVTAEGISAADAARVVCG